MQLHGCLKRGWREGGEGFKKRLSLFPPFHFQGKPFQVWNLNGRLKSTISVYQMLPHFIKLCRMVTVLCPTACVKELFGNVLFHHVWTESQYSTITMLICGCILRHVERPFLM